jgi:hypothetical protein
MIFLYFSIIDLHLYKCGILILLYCLNLTYSFGLSSKNSSHGMNMSLDRKMSVKTILAKHSAGEIKFVVVQNENGSTEMHDLDEDGVMSEMYKTLKKCKTNQIRGWKAFKDEDAAEKAFIEYNVTMESSESSDENSDADENYAKSSEDENEESITMEDPASKRAKKATKEYESESEDDGMAEAQAFSNKAVEGNCEKGNEYTEKGQGEYGKNYKSEDEDDDREY